MVLFGTETINKNKILILPDTKTKFDRLLFCYLNYCPIIFWNTYETHLKPLNLTQKKCIIIISNESPLAHTAPLFACLKMLRFKDIYNFDLGTYIGSYIKI